MNSLDTVASIISIDQESLDIILMNEAMHAHLYISVNDLLQLMAVVGVVILVLIIIRNLYMKFTVDGQMYTDSLNNKTNDYESVLKTLESTVARKSWMDLFGNELSDNGSPTLLSKDSPPSDIKIKQVPLSKYKPVIKYIRPFKCRFRIDEGLEFLSANDNFYNLYNVTDRKELARHYYYVSQSKSGKIVASVPNDSIKQLLHKNVDPSEEYAVSLYEIFDIPIDEFTAIIDIARNKNYDYDQDKVIASGIMELKDLAQYINVSVTYDITIEHDTDVSTGHTINVLVVAFNIKTIQPKINYQLDLSMFNNSNYKEVVRNTLLNLKIPVFFINKSGIKFINKCTYDWLDLPYNNIDDDATSNLDSSYESITDKIDPSITKIVKDMLDGTLRLKTYYEEITLAKKTKDFDDSIHIKEPTKNILVHIEPFEDDKGEIQLLCTLTDSYPIHKYIVHNEDNAALLKLSDDSGTNDITEVQFIGNNFTIKKYNYSSELLKSDKKNNRLSDKDLLKLIHNSEIITYVNDLNDKYQFQRTFFGNTDMVSFGRIDLKTKEILAYNNSFEELLRFDNSKNIYIGIINRVVDDYNNTDSNNLRNFYNYDIHYKTHQVRVVFTYNYTMNALDIVFVNRQTREFLSNDSVNLLNSLYETSDLPIVSVDKKSNIVTYNMAFKDLFLSDDNDNVSLLSLIPETDKRKVSRAISDAIKFNSINHNDTIHMITKDGTTSNYTFKCIKSYSKVGPTDIVTITIFPIEESITSSIVDNTIITSNNSDSNKIVKKEDDAVDASV